MLILGGKEKRGGETKKKKKLDDRENSDWKGGLVWRPLKASSHELER